MRKVYRAYEVRERTNPDMSVEFDIYDIRSGKFVETIEDPWLSRCEQKLESAGYMDATSLVTKLIGEGYY